MPTILDWHNLISKTASLLPLKYDTISGLVNYREGAYAYQFCSFKDPATQNITSYEANQVKGYGFAEGKFFESRKIQYTHKTAYVESILDTVVFFEQKMRGGKNEECAIKTKKPCITTRLLYPLKGIIKDRQRLTLPGVILVPSALVGLTALFGMGRGDPHRYSHLKICPP